MSCDLTLRLAVVARALVAILALAAIGSPARAEVNVADTGDFIIDKANVVDAATRERLENLLKQLERKTGAQVKLLTVPTTDGEDIFTFAQRHADRWKLGQKGKDNGALIVFALKERHVRVHTYYGLEGVLPDSWIGTLSRQIAHEYFSKKDYSQGLDQMVRSVAQKVAQDAGVTIDDHPPPRFMPEEEGTDWVTIIAILLIMALIIYANTRRQRQTSRGRYWGGRDVFNPGPWVPWTGGGGFGGGLGGGGSFGGGFGGGGGSFGGGGRSGGGGGGASW